MVLHDPLRQIVLQDHGRTVVHVHLDRDEEKLPHLQNRDAIHRLRPRRTALLNGQTDAPEGHGEGIGERLTPLEIPAAWHLVLEPPVAVPTARIFADPELKRDSKPIKITAFSVEQAGNDLEPVVCREYPEVAQHLAWLRQAAPAWVTGSGACVFAAFPTEGAARRLWGEAPAGMQGFIARGLERHPLRDLAR